MFTFVLYIFLKKVDEDRNIILGAFFEIPKNCLDILSDKCMKFIERIDVSFLINSYINKYNSFLIS